LVVMNVQTKLNYVGQTLISKQKEVIRIKLRV